MTDEEIQLSKLLKADAEKIRETETFDHTLHQETIRKVRNLESPAVQLKTRYILPLKLTASIALVTIITVLSLHFFQPPPTIITNKPLTKKPLAAITPKRASTALEYRQLLSEGEDKFIAKMNQDARILLQRSPAVFQFNLLQQ